MTKPTPAPEPSGVTEKCEPISESLTREFRDKEYRNGYADSFLNSFIAGQIKVLREQRGLSQEDLADRVGTKQAGISRLEDCNYSGWTISTLLKLAHAFDLRLSVSFEDFESLIPEIESFCRESLQRDSYAAEPSVCSESAHGELTDQTCSGCGGEADNFDTATQQWLCLPCAIGCEIPRPTDTPQPLTLESVEPELRKEHAWKTGAAASDTYCLNCGVLGFMPMAAAECPNGKIAAQQESIDEIMTRLYRRFKEWSVRKFSADDVTWCEVKADVLAIISTQRGALESVVPTRSQRLEDALRDMLAIAEFDQWQCASTGRQIVYRAARAALDGEI